MDSMTYQFEKNWMTNFKDNDDVIIVSEMSYYF